MSGEDVVVIINGRPFAGWKKVSAKQSFEEASGEATLGISEQPGVPLPIHQGDTAQVLFAGRPVVTGFVRQISVGHEWQSHDIEVHIRDKTADMVQSTIGPNLPRFETPIALKDVLRQTLDTMGLSSIQVIDRVNPEPYQPAEVVTSSIDDRGFTFADRWAQKRQTLLNTDGKGNLVIDRNQKRRGPGYLHKGFEDDPLNNVLKEKYQTNDLDQANTTACSGQKSTNDKKHWESQAKGEASAQADPLQKHWGRAVNTAIRPELKMFYRGQPGIEGETPEKNAAWRSSVARGRGFDYTATVQGFEAAPGSLWWPGSIIPAYSFHCELSAMLLIKEVSWTKDLDGGAITELTMAPADSYSDKAEGSKANTRTSDGGTGAAEPGTFGEAELYGPPEAYGSQK